MLPRVVPVAVDTQHDRDVLVLGRRRDDDFLCSTAVDMGLGLGGIGEESRRLDHDVDPKVAPGQVARIPLREDLYPRTVHRQMITVGADAAGVVAEDGIVLQEMSQRRRIGDVIDGDDLEVASTVRGPVDVAPNAAKPIDPNLHRHERSPYDRGSRLSLLDHFDSLAPPSGAADWRPPTCSPAPARRAL